MFLVVVVLLSALAVPVLGGHLSRLADVSVRLAWTLPLALALQVVAINAPGVPQAIRPWIQLGSYPAAGVFVVANRHLPGMALIGLGLLLNVVAIGANGGVMPASASALDRAGLPRRPTAYANSAVVEHPRIAFLGDVFAVPKPLPLHNVFSVGDVAIALGAAIAIHGISGSRLYLARSKGRHLRRRRYRGRHVRPPRGRDSTGPHAAQAAHAAHPAPTAPTAHPTHPTHPADPAPAARSPQPARSAHAARPADTADTADPAHGPPAPAEPPATGRAERSG
jgi:hypothetical protein